MKKTYEVAKRDWSVIPVEFRNISVKEDKASFTVNIDRLLNDNVKVMVKRHLHASLQDLSDKIQQAIEKEILEHRLHCADSVKTHLESVIDHQDALIKRYEEIEEEEGEE